MGIKYFIRQSSCHQRRTWPSRQYVKQTSSTRPDDRCDMRHSRILRLHLDLIITKTQHFRWWNVSDDVCGMDRSSRLSWFVANRSTFDEDMIKKRFFYIFVPNDLDLWPLNLKFAPLVTLVQRYVSTKLQQFLFRFMKIGGTDGGRTERRTGCNT